MNKERIKQLWNDCELDITKFAEAIRAEYEKPLKLAEEALLRSNGALGEYPADTWRLTMQDNNEALAAIAAFKENNK